jgi:CRP-like cAMP-binding protein
MIQNVCLNCLLSPECPDHPRFTLHERVGQVSRYKKNHVLFHQSLPGSGVFYILEGAVKIFTLEENGKEIIHKLLPAGELVGLETLFGNNLCQYSAVVIEDARCSFLDKNFIRNLIHRDPEIMDKFLIKMGKNLDEAWHRNSNMILYKVRERTALCLLELGNHFGLKEKDHIRIRLRLNRDELASVLGVATETAIRFLSEFKRNNYIAEDNRQLLITDIPALQRIIQGASAVSG